MKIASQLAILVLATFNLSAATLYVSLESTNPVAPYSAWTTAATNIQDAVDVAKKGDKVWVTNGVYAVGGKTNEWGGVESRVTITNSIRLESVNGPLVTTVVGSTVLTNELGEEVGREGGRCVYLGFNAVLSGFTLTNGWAPTDGWWGLTGGGVFSEPSGVVTNCTMTGNWSVGGWVCGGGASGGTLYNCTLSGNVADGRWSDNSSGCGGGAYRCILYNCTLTDNHVTGGYKAHPPGGGAFGCTLYNCTVSGNQAPFGGGAYRCILYNCTVSGNQAHFGGGASDCSLYNCTITGNDGGGVGGLWGWWEDSTLYNSIVYYNSGGNYDGGTILNYCCTTPLPTNGVGNITGHPLFRDMAAGDFRLREESPCIDAGTNLLGLTWTYGTGEYDPDTGEEIMAVASYAHEPTDMLGNTRFIDGDFDGTVAWDIGAYEFNSFLPPRFSMAPQRTPEGWRLNITGAPNKWVEVQRSSDLKNWGRVWFGWMGSDGVHQCIDWVMDQNVMFYRAVVE